MVTFRLSRRVLKRKFSPSWPEMANSTALNSKDSGWTSGSPRTSSLVTSFFLFLTLVFCSLGLILTFCRSFSLSLSRHVSVLECPGSEGFRRTGQRRGDRRKRHRCKLFFRHYKNFCVSNEKIYHEVKILKCGCTCIKFAVTVKFMLNNIMAL